MSLLPMTERVETVDRPLLVGMIALGATGLTAIYSATRNALANAGYNPHYYLERQAVFVLLGVDRKSVV